MDLKVISFNIRVIDDPDGHSIEERAPRLYEAVKPYDADVIGFQEFTPAWEKHMDTYFAGDYEIFYKYRAKDEIEAAPILWKKNKFECLKKGYFWLSDTPEVESKGWDELYDCYRICMYAVLRHIETGKEFTFMNTHYGFGDKCHTDSANLIYRYSEEISDNPTFITGDFNMTPDSVGYKAITKYFTDVNAVTSNDMRDTFHDYNPSVIRNMHIDYCFVSRSIEPLSQIIIDKSFDGKFPSDHFGLSIELRL